MHVNFLLLDLNSYFASCEQQACPALRGRPVAVVAMQTNSTSVLAASYEAKKQGIKTGTKVGDAKRMCPDLQLVTTHPQRYLEFHNLILKATDEIIPIDQVLSVDEVSCELKGSQREISNALRLAQKLKDHIRSRVGECLTSSVGLGPNTLIAKIASDLQKPDGLVCVPKEKISEILGPLSIRVVPGIGEKTQYHLNRLGIHKVQDLLSMTEGQIRSKFGSILGVKMLQGLRGEQYTYGSSATKSISHEHVLPPQMRNRNDSYSVAQKLLNKACIRLRKNLFRTAQMQLSIRLTNGLRSESHLKFDPTQDTGFLFKQLEKIFPASFESSPFKVSVVLSDFSDSAHPQLSFFDQDQRRREKAYQTADLINLKFGKNSVIVADLLGMDQKARSGISFSRVPDKDEF
jgi:DNA polymerase-4